MPYPYLTRPNTPSSLLEGNNSDRRRMVAGITTANGAPDNGTTGFYCGGYERVIIETQAVGTSAYYDIDVWFRYAASGLWIRDANVGTQRINSTSPSAFVMCVDGACAVYVQCSNFYGSAAANVWGEGQ